MNPVKASTKKTAGLKKPKQEIKTNKEETKKLQKPAKFTCTTSRANLEFDVTNMQEFQKVAAGMRKPFTKSNFLGTIHGTPAYKEQEEMYEENLQMKKTIASLKSEMAALATKNQRQEVEIKSLNKTIEHLLDNSKNLKNMRCLPAKRHACCISIPLLRETVAKKEQELSRVKETVNQMEKNKMMCVEQEVNKELEKIHKEVSANSAVQALKKELNDCQNDLEDCRNKNQKLEEKVIKIRLSQKMEKKRLLKRIKELKKEVKFYQMEVKVGLSSSTNIICKDYESWSKENLIMQIKTLEQEQQMSEYEIGLVTLNCSQPQPTDKVKENEDAVVTVEDSQPQSTDMEANVCVDPVEATEYPQSKTTELKLKKEDKLDDNEAKVHTQLENENVSSCIPARQNSIKRKASLDSKESLMIKQKTRGTSGGQKIRLPDFLYNFSFRFLSRSFRDVHDTITRNLGLMNISHKS